MSLRVIVLGIIIAVVSTSPVILVSQQQHSTLLTSNDLLNYIRKQTQSHLVQLTEFINHDLTAVKELLKEAGISKEQISSFTTSPPNLQELKYQLDQVDSNTKSNATLAHLKALLKSGHQNLIITVDPTVTPRLLQVKSSTPAESKIFSNMTPFALSGLFVSLFLIIMMLIGVCCLLDLKTNDRFARQNLWVGRES